MELPARSPPLPPLGIFALAELALRRGWRRTAVAILVAAHCLLRTCEITNLSGASVAFSANAQSAVLNLGLTKSGQRTGANESVQVSLPWLAQLLYVCLQSHPVLIDQPWRFRQEFSTLLDAAGLQHFNFKPYSLRRGGATDLWRTSQNLGLVVMRGRWAQSRTARIYINEGLAVCAEFNFLHDVPKVPTLAKAFSKRFGVPLLPN